MRPAGRGLDSFLSNFTRFLAEMNALRAALTIFRLTMRAGGRGISTRFVAKRSRNILRLKIGKIAENRFGADAIREHFEDIAHANAHAANTRAAAALRRAEGDAGLARAFIHSIHKLKLSSRGAEAIKPLGSG